MNFNDKSVAFQKEILKRETGGELIVPVSLLAASTFTNHVCKAGTPLTRQGVIANTSSAAGILLNDVTDDNPNGALVVGYASINTANAKASSGIELSSDAKAAMQNLTFE